MLSSLFARRYVVSRKSHSVINLISGVSAFAVSVPVAAMVILLSVFNGFEGLVRSMYNDFDPDMMVYPSTGKTFAVTDSLDRALMAVEGVAERSYMVEDNAMVEYRGGQYIVTLRGVDSMYAQVVPVEKMMSGGEYKLMHGDIEQAVVGRGVAYDLGVNPQLFESMHFYAPRRGGFSAMIPVDSYRRESLIPAGMFALDAQTDSKYVIAPVSFARRLFDYPDAATSVAVKLAPGADPGKTRARISAALGDDFRPLTRYEQKASLYKIMRYEKWSIFLIIALVLVIASFSVIGSLVMLVIDKRDDVRTIVGMGGTVRLVRGIFVREGMYITGAGAVLGMMVGVGFCLLQQHYGLIRIPAETFLVDSYPVVLKAADLAAVAVLFMAVSWLIFESTVRGMVPKSILRI